MGTPHFDIPLRLLGNGAFATVEQDSVDDISNNVAIILATPVGSRVEVPEFGIGRYEFGTPDPAAIIAAVQEWEPRADLDLDVVAGLGDFGELTSIVAAVRPHL